VFPELKEGSSCGFLMFVVVLVGILVVFMGFAIVGFGIAHIQGMLNRFDYDMLEGFACAFFCVIGVYYRHLYGGWRRIDLQKT
jgi:hypothetical protein